MAILRSLIRFFFLEASLDAFFKSASSHLMLLSGYRTIPLEDLYKGQRVCRIDLIWGSSIHFSFYNCEIAAIEFMAKREDYLISFSYASCHSMGKAALDAKEKAGGGREDMIPGEYLRFYD